MGKRVRMNREMEALVWDGKPFPQGMSWGKFPMPEVRPGWVLVENQATGICGSDLHYLSGAMRHQIPDNNLPAVLGHENAGVVIEVGEGVESFKPGERVVGEPLHACYAQGLALCPACQAGQYHQCIHLGHVGIPARLRLPGGFGSYSIYHQSALFHLPDNVSLKDAAILDVLACGVHALHLGQPAPGQVVVVIGLGAIGLDMIQCLRGIGLTDIVGITPYLFQAELALELGVKDVVRFEKGTNPVPEIMRLTGGADQVYEAVGGTADTIQQAIDVCRGGGKIIQLGFFSGIRPLNLCTLFLKELTLQAADGYSTWGTRREFDIALQMLATGQVRHEPIITHSLGRHNWKAGFQAAFHKSESNSVKVVLTAH